MRTTLIFVGGLLLWVAGSESQAQSRDTSVATPFVLPATAKMKAKPTTTATAPERSVQRDSAAKPIMPRKSKSAPAPARETELPVVTKPPKSPA
jgi:hypothetical protein